MSKLPAENVMMEVVRKSIESHSNEYYGVLRKEIYNDVCESGICGKDVILKKGTNGSSKVYRLIDVVLMRLRESGFIANIGRGLYCLQSEN